MNFEDLQVGLRKLVSLFLQIPVYVSDSHAASCAFLSLPPSLPSLQPSPLISHFSTSSSLSQSCLLSSPSRITGPPTNSGTFSHSLSADSASICLNVCDKRRQSGIFFIVALFHTSQVLHCRTTGILAEELILFSSCIPFCG